MKISRRYTDLLQLPLGIGPVPGSRLVKMPTTIKSTVSLQEASLEQIERLDRALYDHFADKFQLEPALSRALVSFQANKGRATYRWFKFKEAFSAALVEYLLEKYGLARGTILDPFAGSGTTLFAASARGLHAHGIELLPIGQQIIATRKLLQSEFTAADLAALRRWAEEKPWASSNDCVPLNELRITSSAYPAETREAIERFLGACQRENERVQAVLRFVLLCVLESVSYTRKDGQYLRWDHRSGRRQGKKRFDKGTILTLGEAIRIKIEEVLSDLQPQGGQLSFFPAEELHGEIVLYGGSCLKVLPGMAADSYDAIVTSPPYCNRYDYTRTYALELALLEIDEAGISALRQQMLSCTVENRAKDLLLMNPPWESAIEAADRQPLLQAILVYLDKQRALGTLNNNGIPRMVRGYFYEMACVIQECARVLRAGAPLLMVNDNVRYAGASISVDMILSAIAEEIGFRTESILVLPGNKGNSSQQMGEHGRDPLRKCIYFWRKQS